MAADAHAVSPAWFDLGHQGDLDYTLLDLMLAMQPTERLRHHEGWRVFVKGASARPSFAEDVVRRLFGAGVEFVIVGEMSAVLQGSTVVTCGLDVCYRRAPDNLGRLVSALAPLGPRPRGLPADLPFVFDARALQLGSNVALEIGGEALNLLERLSVIGDYEHVVGKAVELTVAGQRVKVLGLEQLIATKTAAGRPKDLAVLPELQAMRERQRAAGEGK